MKHAQCLSLVLQLDQFVEHLNPTVVNDKIFPNLVHGFSDTNPVVRESTIKVCIFCPLYIIPIELRISITPKYVHNCSYALTILEFCDGVSSWPI